MVQECVPAYLDGEACFAVMAVEGVEGVEFFPV